MGKNKEIEEHRPEDLAPEETLKLNIDDVSLIKDEELSLANEEELKLEMEENLEAPAEKESPPNQSDDRMEYSAFEALIQEDGGNALDKFNERFSELAENNPQGLISSEVEKPAEPKSNVVNFQLKESEEEPKVSKTLNKKSKPVATSIHDEKTSPVIKIENDKKSNEASILENSISIADRDKLAFNQIKEKSKLELQSPDSETKVMSKKDYFGYSKYAPEWRGKFSEYFKVWWLAHILNFISLGLRNSQHNHNISKYFLKNSLFRSYSFDYIEKPKGLKIGSLVHSLYFITMIASAFVLKELTLGMALGYALMQPYFYLSRFGDKINNLMYRDIPFSLKLSEKEKLSLSLGFCFKLLLSCGFFLPKQIRNIQIHIFTKLLFGRIYFRFRGEKPSLNNSLFPHIISALFLIGLLGLGLFSGLGMSKEEILELFLQYKDLSYGFVALWVLYTYSAVVNDAYADMFANVQLLSTKFRYKGSAIKLFTLNLSNILLVILSLGILAPIVSYRKHRYLIKNTRVFLNKPGGIEEVLEKAV